MNKAKQQSLTQKAVEAMNKAVQGVIEDHRRRNQPLAIWKDGRVIMVQAGLAMTVREKRAKYGLKK